MLSDMELFEAELQRAVNRRNETKKLWERWAHYVGEKMRQEIYRNLGVKENAR